MMPAEWQNFVANFVANAHEFAGYEGAMLWTAATTTETMEPPTKIQKQEKEIPPIPATVYLKNYKDKNAFRIQIVGDSAAVISWLNCKSVGIGIVDKHIVTLRAMMHKCWMQLNIGPTAVSENFASWVQGTQQSCRRACND